MIQDQLVDYISSQMKTGISRDAIKASLVGAGWQAADVEDTLKKVEGAKPVSGPAMVSSVSPAASPVSAKPAEPQTIKMSDLVSTPSKSATFSASPFVTGKDTKTTAPSSATSFKAAAPSSGKHWGSIVFSIIAAILIIGLAAVAWMFYSQNSTLSAKVASLGGQSSSVTANLASLTSEVQALDASNTALTAQVGALTAQNQDLQVGLSFYVAPQGTIATTTPIDISGTVSGGGKASYALTTSYGAKIYVQNSKDPAVVAALQPMVGSATSTELTGTYVPGSDVMTVTGVNGSSA